MSFGTCYAGQLALLSETSISFCRSLGRCGELTLFYGTEEIFLKKQGMKFQTTQDRGLILVVDDTSANLMVLSQLLTLRGYQVQTAENGHRALEMIAAGTQPDLILLDVMMPEMDGYETCRRLKANEATRDIPVIFITFLKEVSEKVRGFEVGGIDYITKPFQPQEVLARVGTHLTNRKLQQDLLEEYARVRILANATFEGILIHDLQEIAEVNRALEEMSGYQRRALIGQSPLVIIAPEWQERAIHQMRSADRRPAILEGQRQNNQRFSIEIRVSPISWQGREMLVSAIRDISQQLTLEQENLTLRTSLNSQDKLGALVGKSLPMRKVYEQLVRAAAADETAIIYGETGTGKDVAARTIFMLSKQHTKEFVPVNCGAIQESLFESQFFGYRKGAFTGADRDTPGYFERANGGTLFLDEIGELTPTMQIKLLRVLEDHTYTPVGATTSRTTDVRILAATNQELRKLRQSGKIREDFFQRLHVLAIEMPPLRYRKEDIPLLIEYFLQQHVHPDTAAPVIPDHLMERFYAYDWPGNVRELFNELRRYVATGQVELNEYVATLRETSAEFKLVPGERSFYEVVGQLEKQLITQALAHNKGNKMKTAQQLQLPLRTLHRKIKEYAL